MPPSKKGISARRFSRITAVQALYQLELSGNNLEDVISQFTLNNVQSFSDLNKNSKLDLVFFEGLVRETQTYLPSLDQDILDHLSPGWSLERVSLVTLNILRLAVCEMKHHLLTPTPVIINEYIEVTKDFFEEKEAAFVNGLLDAIAKKYRYRY